MNKLPCVIANLRMLSRYYPYLSHSLETIEARLSAVNDALNVPCTGATVAMRLSDFKELALVLLRPDDYPLIHRESLYVALSEIEAL